MLLSVSLVFAACSFDYGAAGESDKSKPDIVMENLEYVRVRGGDPLVRLQADHAERWEDRQTMELKNSSFEQMEDHGDTVNAEGSAGRAVVQLDSGDISLKDGVKIRVDSEDVTIRTAELEWKDKEKTLSGRAEDEVDIQRSDGTSFSGRGFFADARNRTWDFSGEVKGLYVEKEDKKQAETEETSSETSETETPAEMTREAPEHLPAAEEVLPADSGQQTPPAEASVESKPSVPAPDLFPEPKPFIPAPKQSLPPLPEDK